MSSYVIRYALTLAAQSVVASTILVKNYKVILHPDRAALLDQVRHRASDVLEAAEDSYMRDSDERMKKVFEKRRKVVFGH